MEKRKSNDAGSAPLAPAPWHLLLGKTRSHGLAAKREGVA